MEIINQVRGYHFLLGVLRNQQADPYCSVCSAFANTLNSVRENLAKLEVSHAEALKMLAPEFGMMFVTAREGLTVLQSPADPSGQKKSGNCKLPQGVCFVKASFALVQQI